MRHPQRARSVRAPATATPAALWRSRLRVSISLPHATAAAIQATGCSRPAPDSRT
jgi:hypothetical protein